KVVESLSANREGGDDRLGGGGAERALDKGRLRIQVSLALDDQLPALRPGDHDVDDLLHFHDALDELSEPFLVVDKQQVPAVVSEVLGQNGPCIDQGTVYHLGPLLTKVPPQAGTDRDDDQADEPGQLGPQACESARR